MAKDDGSKTADFKTARVKLSDLKEHPKNPRKHPLPGSEEWESLRENLKFVPLKGI